MQPVQPVQQSALCTWEDSYNDFQRQVLDYIKSSQVLDKYIYDPTFYPKPELRLNALKYFPTPDKVRLIILGQDPYPRLESANGIAFHDQAVQLQSHTGRRTSLDNLVSFLNLQNTDYNDFFKRTQERGVMWLNTSLTFDPHQSHGTPQRTRTVHMNYWKPVIQFIFNSIKHKVVILLLGGDAQKIQTPSNFVRINAVHPSPMSSHNVYYNLQKIIDDKMEFEEMQKIEWQ